MPEITAAHEEVIRSGAELVIIAEENRQILGFGAVISKTGELRAVYVGSFAKRSGMGMKILLELENLARQLELKELHMDSSLFAEAFYILLVAPQRRACTRFLAKRFK
jgi:N-acetylglutamate synthase-like GNAT family acetyltransferase